MSRVFDTRDPARRAAGIAAAVSAVARGDLIVMPTDTVYGVGADAFTPAAVNRLLEAKGRGRNVPVPVLVGSARTLHGVATDLPPAATKLVEAFWPGGLTLVCRQQPSLRWDLGDTGGTVAVRMPLHPVAIEVLRETGPMAVSSANRSGHPPARDAAEAQQQLGEAVAIYLEAGPTAEGALASTIVDVTGDTPRVLRQGAVSLEALREVVPDVEAVAS